jgi:hypothetical protein
VELVAERQPLAQFELDAPSRVSRLEAEHVPLDGTTSAEPPPMPYLAMKSKARSELLWIGCQHSTGSPSGAGTKVISFKV